MVRLPLSGDETIDMLLEDFPKAHAWLRDHDIICVECGEVFWGSLKDLCHYRRKSAEETSQLVADLNEYLAGMEQ